MQESIAHLPALLAYQKGSESPTDIMTILQYQKILLKLQLRMRKWLRSTCSPNLPQDELSQTEDALQVMQKFISKRHPDYQESVHATSWWFQNVSCVYDYIYIHIYIYTQSYTHMFSGVTQLRGIRAIGKLGS